ncbi:alkene reductase [Actinoplanes sp. RD1]|uniref:alkene reductase n=1 Tax=Actinoplanes sp. RD1 TaxID=3064538 RepID=UPI0027411359|nr:alkene reductase [Actinoplanes sp. RD1]
MTPLLEPYRLGPLHLPNRVVMAPMTRVRATADGLAGPSTATYYAQRATAGLIVTEGAQPSRQGQSNPHSPGLHTEAAVAAWRPVTAAVHANGGRIFAQLMHGGRVGHHETTGLAPVAPSAVRLPDEVFTPSGPRPAPEPRALSTREVRAEVEVYAAAARRAVDAGFDGVELHGANGYLIQQFLSSNVNLRTDEYGASTAGRVRFVAEVAEAAADAIGAERVGLRLYPGGTIWHVTEDDPATLYSELYRALAPLGLAYVHTLTNGDDALFDLLRKQWPGTYIVNPSAGIVGRPAGRTDGEHWLARGADLVSFGRAYLANPDLVERFRTGLPLREADPGTYYAGGDQGYITWPTHQY